MKRHRTSELEIALRNEREAQKAQRLHDIVAARAVKRIELPHATAYVCQCPFGVHQMAFITRGPRDPYPRWDCRWCRWRATLNMTRHFLNSNSQPVLAWSKETAQ